MNLTAPCNGSEMPMSAWSVNAIDSQARNVKSSAAPVLDLESALSVAIVVIVNKFYKALFNAIEDSTDTACCVSRETLNSNTTRNLFF